MKRVPLAGIPIVAHRERRVILVNEAHPPERVCPAFYAALDHLGVRDDEWVMAEP